MRSGLSTNQQPLCQVFDRVRQRFMRERKYGHEVKANQINTRFKLELRAEIGRQEVFQQLGSPHYQAKTLTNSRARLAKFEDAPYLKKDAGNLGPG